MRKCRVWLTGLVHNGANSLQPHQYASLACEVVADVAEWLVLEKGLAAARADLDVRVVFQRSLRASGEQLALQHTTPHAKARAQAP